MDDLREDDDRLGRLLGWLRATPAELVGLVVLLTGALAATGALWWQALVRPDELPGDGTSVTAGANGAIDPNDAGRRGQAATGGEPAPLDPGSGDGDAADLGGATSGGTTSDEGSEVTVHVTGAVREPGVLTLDAGSRIGDALEAAGGPRGEADLSLINLASALTDGQQVHVPEEGEDPRPSAGEPSTGSGAGGTGGSAPVDVNTAGVDELDELPGIGPAKAQGIVTHRDEHGPFAEPGDLRDVSGIGQATFEGLAELVTTS